MLASTTEGLLIYKRILKAILVSFFVAQIKLEALVSFVPMGQTLGNIIILLPSLSPDGASLA